MTVFIFACVVLLLLATAALLSPFLRRGQTGEPSAQERTLAALRAQQAELEQDRHEGSLSEEDFQLAQAELRQRALQELEDPAPNAASLANTATATLPQPRPRLSASFWTLAIAMPLAATLLYLLLGNLDALRPRPQQASLPDVERMVAQLATRLQSEPDNTRGWLVLAHSYKTLGHMQEAQAAFEHVRATVEQDADLLADYADVLVINQRGDFTGAPLQAITKALKLDPTQPQALWLLGTYQFGQKQYDTAAQTWQRLLAALPANSTDATEVKRNIDEALANANKAR